MSTSSSASNFFESLTRQATELKDRAVFEATKLQRINELNAELRALFTRREQLFTEVGKKALDLAKLGVSVNDHLGNAVENKMGIELQIAMKQEQLTDAKAMTWGNKDGPPPMPTSSIPTPAAATPPPIPIIPPPKPGTSGNLPPPMPPRFPE